MGKLVSGEGRGDEFAGRMLGMFKNRMMWRRGTRKKRTGVMRDELKDEV